MYMFYYLKKYFYYCNNKLNGDEKFEQWNDTSVAHMFIRLMTKSNHPYDTMPLSREQFDADYNLLEKIKRGNPAFYDKIISQDQLEPVEASRVKIKKISFRQN